mmetsp:Transcript_25203/g.34853  ORF Transcript_25203/g.34853 Transcript_25203/m.34853 type:complete len:549 (-) Transcript_25203:310-1956(-)
MAVNFLKKDQLGHHKCFRCTITSAHQDWDDRTKHHFNGSINGDETSLNIFRSFIEKDEDEFAFTEQNFTNSQNWWTLQEKKEGFARVKKLKDEGKPKATIKQAKIDTGMRHLPMTPSEPWNHNLEVIHFLVGITSGVVKLFLRCGLQRISNLIVLSGMRLNVLQMFQLHHYNVKATTQKPLWKRIKACKLNRVQWIKILRSFFRQKGKQEQKNFDQLVSMAKEECPNTSCNEMGVLHDDEKPLRTQNCSLSLDGGIVDLLLSRPGSNGLSNETQKAQYDFLCLTYDILRYSALPCKLPDEEVNYVRKCTLQWGRLFNKSGFNKSSWTFYFHVLHDHLHWELFRYPLPRRGSWVVETFFKLTKRYCSSAQPFGNPPRNQTKESIASFRTLSHLNLTGVVKRRVGNAELSALEWKSQKKGGGFVRGQVLSAGTPQTETLPPRTDFDFFDPQGHLPTSSIPKAPPRAYDPFLSKKRIASNTTTPQKGGSSSASSGSSSSSSPPFLFQDWPALFSKKRKGRTHQATKREKPQRKKTLFLPLGDDDKVKRRGR